MPDIRLGNTFLMPPLSIRNVSSPTLPTDSGAVNGSNESFSDVLSRELSGQQEVKFSKHAKMRLESRNISLGQEDYERLNNAIDKASEKGVSDSLVFMDNLAFIVSIPGKTVVTAMPVEEARANVFTNIDGAVIA